jgi:DNA helicase-2/ATP-dependent DNA helicase PcrA
MNPESRFISEIPSELIENLNEAKKSTSTFNSARRPEKRPPVSRPIAASTGGDGIPWAVGDKAEHKKWGIGTVVSVKGTGEGKELDIAFPSPVGIKRLLAKFAPINRV